jgi:cytochrome c biogenesis protein CcmG, thiol:disulfide interchange protein DsbE
MRRLIVLVLPAVLIAGCGASEPKSAAPSPAAAKQRLSGAPVSLRSLHSQANQLLDGGPGAVKRRLAALRGHPVVVNKWASWCGPCRAEFPFFQRQSLRRGRQIAFLGVNANDNDGDAKRFLRRYPVSYPSYRDPKLAISALFNAVQAFPATAYYDATGKLGYLHQGGYATEAKLAQDVERYTR